MSERIAVAEEATFEPGDRRIVDTKRGEVGVFNVEGSYHAILNRCLHQDGPLCEGAIHRGIDGEFTDPGEWVTEEYTDERVIKCPWHGWEYSLDTGQVVGTEDLALPTFEVETEDGTVYLHV